ncbi:MAG TPA: hypothetical protein VFA63_08740 [Pseudonocardiaceae bacterium]|nr:hypothetical protein [Pseudonocardiaceae bacterium]
MELDPGVVLVPDTFEFVMTGFPALRFEVVLVVPPLVLHPAPPLDMLWSMQSWIRSMISWLRSPQFRVRAFESV